MNIVILKVNEFFCVKYINEFNNLKILICNKCNIFFWYILYYYIDWLEELKCKYYICYKVYCCKLGYFLGSIKLLFKL